MAAVAKDFEDMKIFVPDVLLAGRAMRACIEELYRLRCGCRRQCVGKAVIGTVKGDLHDIGKNLVAVMMTGRGFEVVDLGVDVPAERFIEVAIDERPDLLCMSALLTTTAHQMRAVVEMAASRVELDKVRILVGGSAVTEEYASSILADGFAPRATPAAAMALELVGASTPPARLRCHVSPEGFAQDVLEASLQAMAKAVGLTGVNVSLRCGDLGPPPGVTAVLQTDASIRACQVTLRTEARHLGRFSFGLQQGRRALVPAELRPRARAVGGPRVSRDGFSPASWPILEGIPRSLFTIGLDWGVLYANRFARQELRRVGSGGDSDWQGRPCYELFCGGLAPCEHCPAADVLDRATRRSGDLRSIHTHRVLRFIHPKLGSMAVDVSATPLADKHGRLLGVLVGRGDETVRVGLAEAAIRLRGIATTAELAPAIAESAIGLGAYESAVWVGQPRGRATFSLAARVSTKRGRPQLQGRSERPPAILFPHADLLRNGRIIWTRGSRARLKSHRDVWDFGKSRSEKFVRFSEPFVQEFSVRPTAVAACLPVVVDGSLWGAIVVGYDLGQRQLTWGELEAIISFVELAGQHVERLLARERQRAQLQQVLHNARKPVNAAMNLVRLLNDLPAGSRRDHVAATIRSALGLASAKLQSMMDVWHVRRGGAVHSRLVGCDLARLTRETVGLFEARAQDEGVELDCKCRLPKGRVVVSDPDTIKQVLIELIDNCFQWFPAETPGKRIAVEAARGTTREGWVLYISDNGVGFDEAVRRRAFDPKPSTGPSTGLGLPGVALRVEAFGGHVGILRRPRLGSGSTVAVCSSEERITE